MSGSIFGDDDDFELVGGSDTPSAIRKPPAETPAVRPVTRANPSTPRPASGEGKNPSTRTIPAATSGSTALPRPQLPSSVSKPPVARVAPPAPEPASKPPVAKVSPEPLINRRTQPLPVGWDEAYSGNPKPSRTLPERERVEVPKPVTPAASENPRDKAAPQRREPMVVQRAPVETHVDEPQVKDVTPAPPSNRYEVERENTAEDTPQHSRRSLRSESNSRYGDARANDNDVDDRFSNRRFTNDSSQEEFASSQREESPKSLYSQKPYAPEESPRHVPSRNEQPIQSYPEAQAAPAAKQPQRSSPSSDNKPAKAGRAPREKKAKADKVKGPNRFSGGRSGVVVVRVFAVMIVAVLMLAGGKSIFFPTQIPDPTTITNVVKKRLGVTNFPAENGQAFVTSFTRLYLTVDPANISSTDIYAPYMNSTLASSMTTSNGAAGKQTITEGPIISGVKSVDDENAVYTVGVKLSSGTNWVYVDVPVYYDKDKVGFAVSGMPAFAPAPTKITAPQAGAPFERDAKLADSVKASVMEQFFPAWAASNTAGINLVVLADANSEAKIGLANAVKFVSIQDFTVEIKQTGDVDETTRKAQATVIWASPTDAKITYTQQYNMVLFRQPDNRWYIKELTSGVRS